MGIFAAREGEGKQTPNVIWGNSFRKCFSTNLLVKNSFLIPDFSMIVFISLLI